MTGFEGAGLAGGDVIDLTAIDANTTVAGDQAFTWIGNAVPLLAGQAGYAGGVLMVNVDGGALDLEIQLVGARIWRHSAVIFAMARRAPLSGVPWGADTDLRELRYHGFRRCGV